jgi:hypothetical protein
MLRLDQRSLPGISNNVHSVDPLKHRKRNIKGGVSMSDEQNRLFNRERPGIGVRLDNANSNGGFRDAGERNRFKMFPDTPLPVVPAKKDMEPVSSTNPALGMKPIKPREGSVLQ